MEMVTLSNDCKICSIKIAMCITHTVGSKLTSSVWIDFSFNFWSISIIYIIQMELIEFSNLITFLIQNNICMFSILLRFVSRLPHLIQ